MAATSTPPSARTTVRRLPERGSYDRDLAYRILDEGLVAHVGLAGNARAAESGEHARAAEGEEPSGPIVIPMLYARDGDRLLLHGSPASRLLRTAGTGSEVCVTVTLLDGLVLARSAFHHAVNYRSVVVLGRPTPISDLDERRAALDVLVEHVVPGRTADARPPSERELRATTVLALPLDEWSVKVRTGGPSEEPEDMDLPVWAGVVPLSTVAGPPIADPAMPDDAPPVPAYAGWYSRSSGSASRT